MTIRHTRSICPFAAILALGLACKVIDSDTESGSGSSTSAQTSDSSTASDSSTGSSGTDTGTGTDTTDESTSEGSTGGVECTLEAVACQIAEAGPFLDCGVVGPETNAEKWQTARECALEATANQQAFKLITWLQGIDSNVGYAYVGIEGESYGIIRYFYDSYPPAYVNSSSCTSLSADAACIDTVAEVCLSCEDVGPSTMICGGS